MHLKAVTSSDIASADGHSIAFNSWMAIKGNGLRENINWPQEPPIFSTAQVTKWQFALSKAFGVPHAHNSSRILRQEKRLALWIN